MSDEGKVEAVVSEVRARLLAMQASGLGLEWERWCFDHAESDVEALLEAIDFFRAKSAGSADL